MPMMMIITMNNLFEIFDPMILNIAPFHFLWVNWMKAYMVKTSANFDNIFEYTKNLFHKLVLSQMKILYKSYYMSGAGLITIYFLQLLYINYCGMIPYVMASTSHIVMMIPFSTMMWVGLTIYMWVNFPKKAMLLYKPSNAPAILLPFLYLIELLSDIIRPLTLGLRMAANITAGHLMISLIYSMNCNVILSILISFISIPLIMLEMGVAGIQAYVYTMLVTIYTNEKLL